MTFWFWSNKKILIKISNKSELLMCLSAAFGHFMLFWNSKNLGFSVFLGKFCHLFFENAILGNIGPRTIKNGFSDIFDVLKMIYIDFLAFIISWIFEFGTQKQLEKTFEQSRCFGMIIGRFRLLPAILCFCEIQNNLGLFSIFGQIWQLFFFQNAILGKIGPRTIKNGFSEIV